MIFFTADTHFSDPRVLRIDRRPFASTEDHDAALIATWNELVGPRDEVWHLGDFARGTRLHVENLLSRLNGHKHLIIGNNDPVETAEASGWTSVAHYKELLLGDQRLVLCHYPFRTWNGMGRKAINLHGHSHGRLSPVTRQFDVGVDPQRLRPVTLEQVLASRKRGKAQGATSRAKKNEI